ncbi:hypothetical protein KIL84_018072 [Mauremys mutica]|uniref:Uncharacterized protein n=1 Tax=Mauremys mutica TaxID=74926 RepID=A0A9D4B8M8_9SAUR|nr:hypothetical protein KIL84_018072 [Mauremys mutica]
MTPDGGNQESHAWKQSGWDRNRNIQGSVGLKLLREVDAFTLLLELKPVEDFSELSELPDVPDAEEQLGSLLAVYPGEMEDNPEIQLRECDGEYARLNNLDLGLNFFRISDSGSRWLVWPNL